MKIRVTFSKFGPARWTSHLDVLRVFQRAFRRAGISLAYDGGFSPHAKINFALPLPLGVTSEGEFMDCELEEPINVSEFTRRLGQALPEGIGIVEALETTEKMPKITKAEYVVKVQALPEDLSLPAELWAEKKTKSKIAKINVVQHLHLFEPLWYDNSIRLICDAGGEFNLKPELAINALNLEIIAIHRVKLI